MATQQNYAQIEKEMLATVFGCQKFDYIYGLPQVTIETDHEPLETILEKPLHTAPARLQRMIMSIQKYPIIISVTCRPELLIADNLSRAPLPDQVDEMAIIRNIISYFAHTTWELEELKKQIKEDSALCDLTHIVKN